MIDLKTISQELYINEDVRAMSFQDFAQRIYKNILKADKELVLDSNYLLGTHSKQIRFISGRNEQECVFNLYHRNFYSTVLSDDWMKTKVKKEAQEIYPKVEKEFMSWAKTIVEAIGNPEPVLTKMTLEDRTPFNNCVVKCLWMDEKTKYTYWITLGWTNNFNYKTLTWSVDTFVNVSMSGNDIRSEKDFEEYPEYIPGKILYTTYGELDTNSFYEIVRRSGNTIYTRQLETSRQQKSKWDGYETPIPYKYANAQIFRNMIKDKNYVKINGSLCTFWDNKPKHYDTTSPQY